MDPFLHYIYFGYRCSPSSKLLFSNMNITRESYFAMKDEYKNKYFMSDQYKNSTLLLFNLAKTDGVYIWRGLFQKEHLLNNNINVHIESIIDPTQDFYKKLFSCKTVIFNRPSISSLSGEILGEILRLKKNLIIDIDDLYDYKNVAHFGSVKSKVISYDNMVKNILNTQNAFRYCTAITSSTPFLSDTLKKYNKINILNRNKISTNYILDKKNLPKRAGFSLLIASGSSTHDFDISTIYLDLINFLQIHDDAYISVIGNTSIDLSFFKNRYQKIKILDFKSMLECFSMHDLLLVPLDKNNFNNAKSNIKFIEASSVLTPILAKNCNEFTIIKDQETGFLYDEDFYDKLEWIYHNRSILPKIAQNANSFVRRNLSTKTTNNELIAFIRSL